MTDDGRGLLVDERSEIPGSDLLDLETGWLCEMDLRIMHKYKCSISQACWSGLLVGSAQLGRCCGALNALWWVCRWERFFENTLPVISIGTRVLRGWAHYNSKPLLCNWRKTEVCSCWNSIICHWNCSNQFCWCCKYNLPSRRKPFCSQG